MSVLGYILLYVWIEQGHAKYMAAGPEIGLYTYEQCMSRAQASRARGITDMQCIKIERDTGR
jgi:hypothetical protein